jgi:hypothetical protein
MIIASATTVAAATLSAALLLSCPVHSFSPHGTGSLHRCQKGLIDIPNSSIQQSRRRWSTSCLPRHSSRRLSKERRSGLQEDSDDTFLGPWSPLTRAIVFGTAFLGENVFSYGFAPGADGTLFPQADLDLISNMLLNPVVMAMPPAGSGLGIFSFVLFNSFLWLPLCWALLLYPEGQTNQKISPLPFVLASTAFGGIGMYPYLAIRRPCVEAVAPNKFLRLFEGPIGLGALALVILYLLKLFLDPLLVGLSDWSGEWQGFLHLLGSSQFASTTALDSVVFSILMLDPIMADAQRRGVLEGDASLADATKKLAPFLFPIFGILFWIFVRPKVRDDV